MQTKLRISASFCYFSVTVQCFVKYTKEIHVLINYIQLNYMTEMANRCNTKSIKNKFTLLIQ